MYRSKLFAMLAIAALAAAVFMMTNAQATEAPREQTLTITSPNGGEVWMAGSTHTITWTSSELTGTIDVELYKNGVFYSSIAANVADTGTYSWTVAMDTVINGDTYQVSLFNYDSWLRSTSAGTFEIVQTIELTAPMGGSFVLGSEIPITWTTQGVGTSVPVRIDLYNWEGSLLSSIASTTNSGSYSWSTGYYLDRTVSYKIRVYLDDPWTVVESWSSTPITFTRSLALTSPSGGENWTLGTAHTLTWTASGIDPAGFYNLELYQVQGGDLVWFGNIASSIPVSDRSYLWTVGYDLRGSELKVKISTYYTYDPFEAFSSGTFSIWGGISVTQPSSGQNFTAGSVLTIAWSYQGMSPTSTVEIHLERWNSYYSQYDYYCNVASDIPINDLSLQFPLPYYHDPQVRVVVISQQTYWAAYGGPFILWQGIQMSSPNGGTYALGQTVPVRWTSQGITGDLYLSLYDGESSIPYASVTVTDNGTYDYFVAPDNSYLLPGNNFYLHLDSVNHWDVGARNQVPFSITEAQVQITSPVGGESWVAGSAHTITWTSTGLPFVAIYLMRGGDVVAPIAWLDSDPKAYSWTIPSTITPSIDYAVKVEWMNYLHTAFSTSGVFQISANPNPPYINVISPNGGESWLRLSTYDITWTSGFVPGSNVGIGLIPAGQMEAVLIVESTPNDGYYEWNIDQSIPLGSFWVQIFSINDPSILGKSAATFDIITDAYIDILSPLNGDHWVQGSSYNIAWSSYGPVGDYVALQMVYASQATYDIVFNTTSHSGINMFSWTIPTSMQSAGNLKIRVTSLLDNAIFGQNQGYFVIGNPPAINVTYPSGGETFYSGDVLSIQWESFAAGPNVGISLRQGGPMEGPVLIIASSTANSGSYTWTIPSYSLQGSDFYIVIASLTVEVFGFNAQPFSIITYSPSQLYVNSPSQGEVWPVGTTHSILISGTTIGLQYDLKLVRGGVVQSIIGTFTADSTYSQYYNWTVPDVTTGTDYRIQISSHGGGNTSNGYVFTIRPQSGSTIQVTYPTGGSTLTTFMQYQITWTDSTPGRTYMVYLYNATMFGSVVQTNLQQKWYNWTALLVTGGGYRIYVAANDGSDGSMSGQFTMTPYDFTNGYSGMQGAPGLITGTTIRTYGGQALVNLTWTPVQGTWSNGYYLVARATQPNPNLAINGVIDAVIAGTVHIDYSSGGIIYYTDQGSAWIMQPMSSFAGCVDNKVTVGQHYWYWVWSYSSSMLDGQPIFGALASSSYADIVAGSGETTSITVTVPHASDNVAKGSTVAITWSSLGNVGQTVRIELRHSFYGTPLLIADGVANSGHYSWTVPNSISPSSGYFIRISGPSSGVYGDSGAFTLYESGTGFITVTSPMGGESWTAGSSHAITWTSGNVTGPVDIALMRGLSSESILSIANAAPNSGSYSWTIPAGQTAASDYRVFIRSNLTQSIVGYSPSPFSITGSAGASITLTFPNGGQIIQTGSQQTITWTSSGVSGNVEIELRVGGASGTKVLQIADNIANSGSYAWTVSSGLAAGNNYYVVVRSKMQSSIFGASAAAFSIVAPTPGVLTVTSPTGGEQWQQNTSHQITFSGTYVGTTYTVKLLKGGVEVGTIASYVATGTSGSVAWTVTQAVGSDYRVQVTSSNQTATSAANFSITVSGGGGGSSDMTMIIVIVAIVAIGGVAGGFLFMKRKGGK